MAERQNERDERRGLRKINTGHASEGVYTRAPRAIRTTVVFNLGSFYRNRFVKKGRFEKNYTTFFISV